MNSPRSRAALRVVLPALIAVACCSLAVQARTTFPTAIPNGEVFDCANCHIDINQAINLTWFGTDVALAYQDFENPKVAWSSVYLLDSDADGQTNGEELGDPCGEWEYGDPDTTEEPSNPGDDLSTHDEVPAYECSQGDDDDSAGDDDDSAGTSEAPSACLYTIGGGSQAFTTVTLLPLLWLLVRRRVRGGRS